MKESTGSVVTGSELNDSESTIAQPRAGRSWRRRISAALALLFVVGGLVAIAEPANADPNSGYLNFGVTQTVSGTNCTIRTGTWYNTSKLPGTAAYVSCATPHTVYLQLSLRDALPGYAYSQLGYSAKTTMGYVYTTSTLHIAFNACPAGARYWAAYADVWIDGVYRGYGSSNAGGGRWAACT